MDFGIILSLIIFIIFIIYLFYINNKSKTIENIEGETIDQESEYISDIYESKKIQDTFSFNDLPQFKFFNSEGLNHILNICGDISGTIFNNLAVSKDFKIRGKDIKYYAANALYPIGSFYVQYPDKNTNDLNLAFPEKHSPAVLFGGKWEEQWNGESIFFRTRGVGLSYDNENRTKGLQDFAIKQIKGSTDETQMDRWGANNPTGVFDTEYKTVGSDSSTGTDWGIFNRFDNGFQSLVSDKELRARNRLCKVWKRVLDADDVVYDKDGKLVKLT
jgi:hypothetical protein